MSRRASVRIDRLVIDGGGVDAGEARDVARAMAEHLSDYWAGGAPELSRDAVRVQVDAPRGLAAGTLARQMAEAVIREHGRGLRGR